MLRFRFIRRIVSKCRDQKGFTLIEMLTATALVAIFFTMAASVLPSWFQNYKNMITLSYARQIANTIVSAVEGQLLFASDVSIKPGSGNLAVTGKRGNTVVTIPETMEDGTQSIEGLVYDSRFYRGMDVKLTFEVNDSDRYCIVTVVVKDADGSTILEKTRAVRLSGKQI